MRRTAIGFDPADKIALESLDLTAAAATAEPLQVLSALDTGHLLGSQFTECLSRDVFHRGGAATCLSGEVLFLQYFPCRIAIRTVLVKAVTDLCVQKAVRCDLDDVTAVTAAQPDHLAVKALRCLFDRNQMTKSLVLDVLHFTATVFNFLVSDNRWHIFSNNPLSC